LNADNRYSSHEKDWGFSNRWFLALGCRAAPAIKPSDGSLAPAVVLLAVPVVVAVA